jgi:hypothetical protein
MLRMIRARIGNMLQRHCWAVLAGLRGFKFNFDSVTLMSVSFDTSNSLQNKCAVKGGRMRFERPFNFAR